MITPVFYVLPKVHKGLFPPPGRPIVSGCSSILEPLGIYLDTFLQAAISNTPSYIKDTGNFIKIIENVPVEPDYILLTMDVRSLYTSIPHEMARFSVMEVLRRRQEQRPSSEFLIQLLDLIVEKNYFRFEDTFYMQIKGAAMGCSAAPSIANIFMAAWGEKYIMNETNPFYRHICIFKRYLDDLFFVLHNKEVVQEFCHWLDQRDENIGFTWNSDEKEINFLGITVFKSQDNKLEVRPYNKPTDRNSYLSFDSYHSASLRENIPYGQFLRLKRNSTRQEDYIRGRDNMMAAFRNRGYPERVKHRAKCRTDQTPRYQLLEQKWVEKRGRLFWSLDYTPLAKSLENIVRRHGHLVMEIAGCESPPGVSYRQTRNLKEVIIHSDMTRRMEVASKPKGNYRCGHCALCPLMLQGNELKILGTGRKIRINHFATCQTEAVIYLLICPCEKLYVGNTIRQLRVRVLEHISRIRSKVMGAPLTGHFLEEKHSATDMKVAILTVVRPTGSINVNRELLKREAEWIFSLRTLKPKGLNTELSLQCYLID
ncbi:uncharacterized protein LOC129341953 [Eublepharis macularius]|uniref:Uncharacterized protein LOC129341953 n=1 Tax=Eublepharis macularius TaxID=481883 RepID=A0AA97LFB9_EUBMA|nr:uncharacterized protein LOC129341953 [Eublepharis macularius]